MAGLEYFLVSESAVIDQDTNRVSIFNIIEAAPFVQLPGHFPALSVVTCWVLDRDEIGKDFQQGLRIRRPGQPEPEEYLANFVGASSRHRIIQVFQGIPIQEPGQLHFEVLLNGNRRATHVVEIDLLPPQSPPTPGRGT